MRSILPRPPPGGRGDGQHGRQHLPRPHRVSRRSGRNGGRRSRRRHDGRWARWDPRRRGQNHSVTPTGAWPARGPKVGVGRRQVQVQTSSSRCDIQVVLLSGSVIVLAYVAAAAVIIPAVSMIGFGKVPKFLRRRAAPGKTRTRMEGTGLLLIGMFILADALAADLGRRSSVPQDWILLVWVLLAAGLIGLRHPAGRTDPKSPKPTA